MLSSPTNAQYLGSNVAGDEPLLYPGPIPSTSNLTTQAADIPANHPGHRDFAIKFHSSHHVELPTTPNALTRLIDSKAKTQRSNLTKTATAAGISRPTLYNWINNNQGLNPIRIINQLAKRLLMTCDDLIRAFVSVHLKKGGSESKSSATKSEADTRCESSFKSRTGVDFPQDTTALHTLIHSKAKRYGFSLERLAEESGSNRTSLDNWTIRKPPDTLFRLVKLADHLRMTCDDLIGAFVSVYPNPLPGEKPEE